MKDKISFQCPDLQAAAKACKTQLAHGTISVDDIKNKIKIAKDLAAKTSTVDLDNTLEMLDVKGIKDMMPK